MHMCTKNCDGLYTQGLLISQYSSFGCVEGGFCNHLKHSFNVGLSTAKNTIHKRSIMTNTHNPHSLLLLRLN
jgi:hypothetical protein